MEEDVPSSFILPTAKKAVKSRMQGRTGQG